MGQILTPKCRVASRFVRKIRQLPLKNIAERRIQASWKNEFKKQQGISENVKFHLHVGIGSLP